MNKAEFLERQMTFPFMEEERITEYTFAYKIEKVDTYTIAADKINNLNIFCSLTKQEGVILVNEGGDRVIRWEDGDLRRAG